MAKKTTKVVDKDLLDAVKDSYRDIWLAGLGAFGRAQVEGGKYYESLIKDGEKFEKRAKEATGRALDTVKAKAGLASLKEKTDEGLDRLDKIFEDRVSGVLKRLGIPSNKDIGALNRKYAKLSKAVEELAENKRPTRVQKAA